MLPLSNSRKGARMEAGVAQGARALVPRSARTACSSLSRQELSLLLDHACDVR